MTERAEVVGPMATELNQRTERSTGLWILIQVLMIGLGAYYLTSIAKPGHTDADIIVGTLAGLHNLTLFFWDQDRLANLTALLVSPFHSIGTAIYAYTAVQATYFSGLVFILCGLLHPRRSTRLIAFIATIAILGQWIPDKQLYVFAKHAQPYAASTLAVLAAYVLPLKVKQRLGCIAGQSGLMLTALLLNPLSGFLALTLPLSSVILCRNKQRNHAIGAAAKWTGVVISTALGARWIQEIYRQQMNVVATPLALNPGQIPEGLGVAWERLFKSYDDQIVALVMLGLMITYAMAFWIQESPLIGQNRISRKENDSGTVVGWAITLNVISTLVIASSEWVQAFGYPLRYFFPIYLLAMTACVKTTGDVVTVVQNLMNHHPQSQRLLQILLGVLGSALLITGFNLQAQPIAPPLATYKQIRRIQPVFDYLEQNKLQSSVIGGNFGLSWSLYAYSLEQNRPIPTVSGRSTFDPASQAQHQAFAEQIQSGQPIDFYCLQRRDNDPKSCEDWVQHKIHLHSPNNLNWTVSTSKEITFASDGKRPTTLLKLRSEPQQTTDPITSDT